MGKYKYNGAILIPILLLLVSLNNVIPCNCKDQLSPTFYAKTCPKALKTIRKSVKAAVSSNPRNAALLVRLHFHDCFVQGCDASLLLEGNNSEKASPANDGVLGYEVVDAIKAAVERVCPGVVSCADILTLAARDATVAVKGPSWSVRLGRRDSTTFNANEALNDLPRGNFNLSQLIDSFQRKGLNAREMVALSGSHTIGQARCTRFRARIYDNTSNIDAAFASRLRHSCPPTAPNGDGNLQPLDFVTPNRFDNYYFRNLVGSKGLLISDQALFNGDSTDSIVTKYVRNPSKFDADFAAAMIKMGEIDVLTGTKGIIRSVCTSAS